MIVILAGRHLGVALGEAAHVRLTRSLQVLESARVLVHAHLLLVRPAAELITLREEEVAQRNERLSDGLLLLLAVIVACVWAVGRGDTPSTRAQV